MNHPSINGPRGLPLPDLSAAFPGPFPSSPHADAVERHLRQWTDKLDLLPTRGARRALCNITGQGVARALPDADVDGLALCAELFLWLVAFDDVHGEATAAEDPVLLVDRVAEVTRVLAGDNALAGPDDPVTAGLRDLLRRLRARATPTQYLRLAGHLRDNLVGLVWEAHHLNQPDCVTVQTYCAMRPYTVFVYTLMATAPIVLSYDLSDDQRASASVRQLETAVANLAGWVNDLASHVREADRLRAAPLSLPTVLMAEHRLSFRQAFETASHMCEEEAAVARELVRELSASRTRPLAHHAAAMECIAHSFIWHVDHDRYAAGPSQTVPPHLTTGSPSCP
ncbi:terpene synthase family protein [[Kitasatospora] papulosa]|uniref:terpene synthase family protein n=1 Tax=[Kitasatospora] papulosa TaxID=1464011 RepID=UPI00362A8836